MKENFHLQAFGNVMGQDGARVDVLGMWWEGMEQGWVFYSSVANLSFLGLFL